MTIITPPDLIKAEYQVWLDSGRALALQTRLASQDPTIWSDDEQVQASIRNRLGWLKCIDLMLEQSQRIVDFVESVTRSGYKHCVLLGMGGSSLAPEMFNYLFSGTSTAAPSLTFEVLDNTSADAVNALSKKLDLSKSLFVVASKSGTTIETNAFYSYFYDQLETHISDSPSKHFVAITDPDTPLARQAAESHFFDVFINAADVGGRFSALSYFGIVPAALIGIDICNLLNHAKLQLNLLTMNSSLADATRVGVLMGLAANRGIDKIILSMDTALVSLASWMEQLIAESTGKSGKGIVPIIEVEKAHYQDMSDKILLRIGADEAKHQTDKVHLKQDFSAFYQLGAQLLSWEWSIAVAGAVMKINPFDEPNVCESKAATLQVLKNLKKIPQIKAKSAVSINSDDQLIADQKQIVSILKRFQTAIKTPDYLAILCYAPSKTPLENAFAAYRLKLVEEKSIVTTLSLGPRYLHSTGQLHKGGANNGVFIVVTTQALQRVAIAGKAFDFNQLNHAQAQGDLNVLKAHKRRLIHLQLKDLSTATLSTLTRFLEKSFD